MNFSKLQLSIVLNYDNYYNYKKGENCCMSNKKLENSDFYSSQRGFLESSSQKPIIPICMISSHLVNKLRTQVIPALQQIPCNSIIQKATRYEEIYMKEFELNKRLNNQLAEVIQDRNMLADKYNSIKRMKSTDDAVRRKRRYARDIERLFYCPIQRCKRGYGSQGSLSHHVRLKHLEFYQSGNYQIFIQKYIDRLNQNKKKPYEVPVKNEHYPEIIIMNRNEIKNLDEEDPNIKVQQN